MPDVLSFARRIPRTTSFRVNQPGLYFLEVWTEEEFQAIPEGVRPVNAHQLGSDRFRVTLLDP